MKFCSKCHNAYGLKKIVNKNAKIIASATELIELVMKNAQVLDKQQFIINISDGEIKKNSKFKKLPDDDKQKIIKIYFNLKGQVKEGNYYICNVCNHHEKISQGDVIYVFNINSKKSSTYTKEDLRIKCHDITLPRTKDFICQNKKCNSHKNGIDKEAVIFRSNPEESYESYYVCCECYTAWKATI